MNSSLSILKTWLWIFGVGVLWESMIRIYLFHASWDVWNSVLFTFANLAWGLLCAVVFGFFHVIVVFVATLVGRIGTRLKRWILPASAVAAATLLSLDVLYEFRFL